MQVELESKVRYLLENELCGLDTAAAVLRAAGYPIEEGYSEVGEPSATDTVGSVGWM